MIIDDFSNPKRKLTVSEASAANDYFTRRKSEEDRIAGIKAPAKNKKNPANTDYATKRKQQDVEESFGRRPDHGREERHDLDPTDWYIVKDGKMFAASIYPRQVKQAIAQGFSRTKQEARARAGSQGVAEGKEENIDQFISGNLPNFNGESNRVSADTAEYNFKNFLKEKGFTVDNINYDAYPVLVAICQGKMCAWYDFKNAYGYVSEQGKVVFSGTGANGGKYEIIHHGDDFMIRANGKHIDSYGSLKRAMGVLKNEVPGLKQGVAEGGAETSWSNDTDTITLQDILELTKHIKQINLPINDNLKSKLLHWEGNPEEIERVNQVTVSNQFPILIMVDEQGQIEWILDGNHRLHKAIQSQAKTIPAKLIKPSNLNDKAKKIFNIKEQGVAEGLPGSLSKSDYTPGATKKHVSTNCTTCHGRKGMYKLDGKLFADNKVGAERVKCPTCKGTGDKQGVAEGEYDSRKPFGVRYKVFAGREGRMTTREYWTSSEEKLQRAVDKIQALDNFYEIDGYSYPKEPQGVTENAEDLHIGDPVIITGNGIEFEGATGEIINFGQQHRFVVVDLYNHGRHSFHSSDVSFNEYAGSDDEEARMYDAGEVGDDYRDEMDEAEEPMQSPEQIAYNQLRAQWDGYQFMTSGGGNTYVSRDPAHAAKLATIPAQLAKMAAALKAKGIDAEAEYNDIGGPKAAPVDINQKYVDEVRMSAAQRLSTAWDRQRAKSDASLRRTPSSIPKKEEPKKADPVPKTVSEHRAQRRALMAQMLNSR